MDEVPDNDTDRAILLIAAKLGSAQMIKAADQAIEQLSNTSKWLLASLLAINGGGDLAALNFIKDGGSSIPAIWFTGGMMLALLSGVVIQHLSGKLAAIAAEAGGYWARVETIMRRSFEEEQAWEKRNRFWTRMGLVAPMIGWFSGVAFLIGAIQLGQEARIASKAAPVAPAAPTISKSH